MKFINGKKIANKILSNIRGQMSGANSPTLAVILIGSNPASRLYVSIKQKRSAEIGIGFKKYLFAAKTKQAEIIKLIKKLNNNKKISAILVQLPLPKHLNTDKIISAIDIKKDADGIHPKHLNQLKKGQIPPVLPATTGAILEALNSTKTQLKNKSVAIIGKSKIVGEPTYYYLRNGVKKINIYNSKTRNLAQKTSQADILITAIGKPKFINTDYIKKNAIVIDVGINKFKNKTVGDVDFENAKNKAAWITPVPGGIGPITVAVLLKNVLSLSKK